MYPVGDLKYKNQRLPVRNVILPDRPKAGQPEPFLRTAANETRPAFSPDGRWVAFERDRDRRGLRSGVREPPGSGREVADLERRWRHAHLVAKRARVVLSSRPPDHGFGLHRSWKLVRGKQAPPMVEVAATPNCIHELRPGARRQAVRGGAGLERLANRGPRDDAAQLLRRAASPSSLRHLNVPETGRPHVGVESRDTPRESSVAPAAVGLSGITVAPSR